MDLVDTVPALPKRVGWWVVTKFSNSLALAVVGSIPILEFPLVPVSKNLY